jgi:hypothetical protein
LSLANHPLERQQVNKNKMEDLNARGLHFDEFQKMRVLDPELASTTKDLKEECGTFLENMSDFRTKADGFIAFSDQVSFCYVEIFKDFVTSTDRLIVIVRTAYVLPDQMNHLIVLVFG